jgi:DNA-binding XRE family transcriptional regulator
MAKNGEYRPTQKTKIGRCLSSYTIKSHNSYDPVFDKTIRRLRPDWFVSQTQVANQKKQKLIQMAKNGEYKPNWKTKIGICLTGYTVKSSKVYDPVFDKTIRKLRPDWFLSQTQVANQKKQKLIQMAKNGEDKPNWKTKIGICLNSYTKKSNGSYDPVFDKTIRKLRPDWFVSPTQIANQKKQKLIQMAKNGEDKPKSRTKIGNCLNSYTKKSNGSYDPVFDKIIRELRPDWFKN